MFRFSACGALSAQAENQTSSKTPIEQAEGRIEI